MEHLLFLITYQEWKYFGVSLNRNGDIVCSLRDRRSKGKEMEKLEVRSAIKWHIRERFLLLLPSIVLRTSFPLSLQIDHPQRRLHRLKTLHSPVHS